MLFIEISLSKKHTFIITEQQPNVMTIVSPPMASPCMMLPKTPTKMTCPSFHHQITTKVQHKSTMKTHLVALACCMFL
jgi:hypothetical protein